MLGLSKKSTAESFELESASRLLPELWFSELDEYTLDLRWSSCGDFLAAMPSLGRIMIFEADGRVRAELPGHEGGNGAISWHPKRASLLTYGQDAVVRIHSAPFNEPPLVFQFDIGWADRARWSPDGTMVAACVGKCLYILDSSNGAMLHTMADHKSTICDISWNPKSPREIATVCDGGARLWRLGIEKPIGHFDWGGASLIVTWSPNGRWIVTGDQTPSVHLYETNRKHPLHIQGFETKVKSLAWERNGEWLATGGGPSITLWPCTGRKGPEGAKPIQLFGHLKDVQALDFVPGQAVLASSGRDGMILLWMPHRSVDPALIDQRLDEISALRWAPNGQSLACGTATGHVILFQLTTKIT